MKLYDLQSKRYAISDNGKVYYPESIFINLNGKNGVTALFDMDNTPVELLPFCNRTSHIPPMNSVRFKSDGEDDVVEIIELHDKEDKNEKVRWLYT